MITAGTRVLGERYELIEPLVGGDEDSQTWLGVGEYEDLFLLKLWPYEGERPDDVKRALWDAELRTLYRVGSSPGADDVIVLLRDAGVDRNRRCFAMVLQAPGLTPLADLFAARQTRPWLAGRSPEARRRLWGGLHRLADGLRLLHEQQVLHRAVSVEGVYLDPEAGPESMRLGGFEWSIRLGVPAHSEPPPAWSTPPEMLRGERYGYRMETDWYGFGIVAARCLLDLENFANREPLDRHGRVVRAVERSVGRLTELERDLLLLLIADDPRDRLARGDEIGLRIGDIESALESGPRSDDGDRALVLVANTRYPGRLLDAAEEAGFQADPENASAAYNPTDPTHSVALTRFLTDDLRGGQLHAIGDDPPRYVLVGERMSVAISSYEHVDRGTRTTVRNWDAAYCLGPATLRVPEGISAAIDLPPGTLAVRSRSMSRMGAVLDSARSWETILPRVDKAASARIGLHRFHQMVRGLNQIELLMRDAELFHFALVERPPAQGNFESIVIEEIDREQREPADFCRIDGGMVAFLQQERDNKTKGAELVILTPPEQNGLTVDWVSEPDQWKVTQIDGATRRVTLTRAAGPTAAPDHGILRAHGMFGQVRLIRRRKRAIDKLKSHAYLLKSLSSPGQVFMDTGPRPLLVELDPERVDASKREAIQDILRIRPIYSLQGPPGTGKTTLVAWLVREILEEDPVAQILVTAQAHGAVDVLRDKVREEAYRGIAEELQPLAVRLGAYRAADSDDIEDAIPAFADAFSVHGVALAVLDRARLALPPEHEQTRLQKDWAAIVEQLSGQLRTGGSDAGAPDFVELVTRGAHLTYCTTSAGQLEALADMTQSFDWSILEEAGKAHTFDLALPLQAGHRWLLIGDHLQLPPYRWHDYLDAVGNLEAVVVGLENLPAAGSLVDEDWIRWWRDETTPEDREQYTDYLKYWLNAFKRIFEECTAAVSIEDDGEAGEVTRRASRMITGQHRMHPDIGTLVSQTYYDGELSNETVKGDLPIARVLHPFVKPEGVAGRAIVWLDLSAAEDGGPHEHGGDDGTPRYTNPAEVDALARFLGELRPADGIGEAVGQLTLAALSPYNRQVGLMNEQLEVKLPDGVSLKQALRRRRAGEAEERFAHSVDSFQGNQASVIAVSLVRNNLRAPGDGLGFLTESPRVNVLLSRGERMLVLVGSFDFFSRQVALIDLADKTHPLWHWKRVVTTLGEWFEEGRALRLPAAA